MTWRNFNQFAEWNPNHLNPKPLPEQSCAMETVTVTPRRKPAWMVRWVGETVPTCTIAKSLAFAMILHPRLGNQSFGKHSSGQSSFAGKELPMEIAIMIMNLAMGSLVVNEMDTSLYNCYMALCEMCRWAAVGRASQLKQIRTIVSYEVTYQRKGLRYQWHVPFIVAAPPCDGRLMTGKNVPRYDWLQKFMQTACMPVPGVGRPADGLNPMLFCKKITGSRVFSNQDRPAFAGCFHAEQVRESCELLYKHKYGMVNAMEAWWSCFQELFDHARRYFLPGRGASFLHNFVVFHIYNPDPEDKALGLVSKGPRTLSRTVTANMVLRWLKEIWGEFNVDTYFRARDKPQGVQVFIMPPRIMTMEADILNSEVFTHWNRYYRTRAYLPL